MTISDSYLFDLGWLFFAAWGVIVAVVSLAAFRHDLFPARPQPEPVPRAGLQSASNSK